MALAGDLAKALSEGNVLLRAEPGAGKSTGLPLALLLQANLSGKIILLEPRRLAARSVAQRLALHLGETVGQRIGLRMRSDTRVSADTQLEVVTEGVLTRLLQSDPALEDVALVIFDEFHERSVHADLGIALCLEVQQALREDLRLLLMSATLDTELVKEQLGDVAVFECPVRQHPVDLHFLGESSELLPQRIASTVLKALHEQTGDVLVFLPGVAEISRTEKLLSQRLRGDSIQLHQLHSGTSASAQALATAPATPACRRVILSTSLAETSITIDGVRVVIDSGLERRSRTDPGTGAQMLETVTASQASATQRTGRAGRTAPGICYRLWSETAHSRRSAQWQPEILRADAAPLLMELGLWGAGSEQSLPWLTPPPQASLSRAKELLIRLGVWELNRLSTYGKKVAALSVHPRFGHMLLWAGDRGALELACRLVAWHEEQRLPGNEIDLDALSGLPLPAFLQRRSVQLNRAVQAVQAVQAVSLRTRQSVSAGQPSSGVMLAQAFPDWIGQCRPGKPGRFLLACGAGVNIDQRHALAHCQWIVVSQMGGAGKAAQIFRAIALDVDELEAHSPELFTCVNHLDWEESQEKVIAERRTMIGNLTISAQPLQPIDESDRAIALMKGIRKKGVQCLPWTEDCREWQARVLRMGQFSIPGQAIDWPAVDDEALAANLESWLLPFLSGLGSMKAVRQLNLLSIMQAMLSYRKQALLDEWLPTRYTVPSGSRIRLTYIPPGNPVLSVRLQEMLGSTVNPTVANGRLRLKVELLSPAMRPIQLTEDLVGFWTGSYPAVKKEMAGRYPKHIWPENPLDALPTTRAKPRKHKQ